MKFIALGDGFVQLFGAGLVAMGIMDFVDDEEAESVDADGDDPFGEGVTDGGGGMDGEFDDDFGGMDDGMEMDDEMDDWAEGGGDDEFAMGGGTGPTQELENRIDELENEVADISSTVSTVRSENEQISEKVDETEENVRKLLEIYEMVTRGVNPFVDDVQGGVAGGDAFGEDAEGGFGLFDGEEDEETEEDLDEDVVEAEAESFFDDDFDDDGGDEGSDEDPADDGFEDDGFEDDAGDELGFDSPDEAMGDDAGDDGFDDGGATTDDGDDAEDSGGQAGGSTFEELKEEYESGDADWVDDADGDGGTDVAVDDAPPGTDEPGPVTDEPDASGESAAGEFEFEDETVADDDDTGVAEPEPTGSATGSTSSDASPYLAELPNGYAADLVVMEWLEFLVEEFGPADAVRTVEYYAEIGWISESVEEELLAFARGFADVDAVESDETGPATLEIDDHVRSLTFLSRLTGDAVERRIVEHCAQIRGGRDGIQR